MKDNLTTKNRIGDIVYRKNLIKSFIDISTNFTQGAYDKLISIQSDTKKIMLDPKEGNDEYIVKKFTK